MGRIKNGKAGRLEAIKATAHKNLPVTKPTISSTPIVASDLLDEAEQCLVSCDLDEAVRLCREVLNVEPHNPRALEALAVVELESGEIKAARKLLNQCVTHSKPSAPPTVYLYLAQLADTAESALQHFETALVILREKLEEMQKTKSMSDGSAVEDETMTKWTTEETEVRRSCSRTLVGMTELYLTDLCFDPSAEEKCLEYLALASSLDPTDPEPLQTLASVRISQTNMDAAREALLLAWSLWREKSVTNEEENVIPVDGMDEDAQEESGLSDEDVDNLPPFESRVQWSKLAIECDLWSAAIEVLQQCETENDEEGEVQYLLAVAWHMMGESREKNPTSDPTLTVAEPTVIGQGLDKAECWMEAKEYLEACLQLHERLGDESSLDESILKHIEELMAELNAAGIPSKPDAEHDKDEADTNIEDEWEDASDVEMET